MEKTSIYIELYLWKKVCIAKEKTGLSKQAIIHWLIHSHFKTAPNCKSLSQKLRNRPRKPKGYRIIRTINLNVETYNCCMDLRKVYRTSVSAIIAEGIIRQLDQCIRELSKRTTKPGTTTDYLFCCHKRGTRLHYEVFTYLPDNLDAILSPG
jgi:hypothetical protein